MRLKPFARSFADRLYRVDYFVVCSREQDFHPTLLKLIKRTSKIAKLAPSIVRNVAMSPVDGCNGRCWRLAISPKLHVIIIWLRPGADVSVVTHEIWHAAFWVFQERGATLDSGVTTWRNGADEPMAYYLQWLVRSVLNL